MTNKKTIEDLLQKFFNGQTTNDDEKRLYEYFSRDDLPDELAKYRPVMQFFKHGMADEFASRADDLRDFLADCPPEAHKTHLWLRACAAAAAVLILGFVAYKHFLKPFDPYEGSYIIRNGVKITDLNRIRPELETTLYEAESIQNEMQNFEDEINEIIATPRHIEQMAEAMFCDFTDAADINETSFTIKY